MSKREGNSNMSDNAPEPKKQKVGSGEPDENKNTDAGPAEKQRPNSPVAGPSSASSDPHLQPFQAGLIPIYRYFDPKILEEGSSQGSTSNNDAIATTSTTDTTSSTNVEVGDSRTASIEDMDIDTETSSSESSASIRDRRRRQNRRRFRKHKSRRDQ